jgi:hypothetical protein
VNILSAVATEIALAHVVDEDEEHVGLPRRRCGGGMSAAQNSQERE